MKFNVVKAKKRSNGVDMFEVANGMKLFGVWFRGGEDPVVQRIVIPFDESGSARYLNVENPTIRASVLGAVESFVNA